MREHRFMFSLFCSGSEGGQKNRYAQALSGYGSDVV